MCLQKQDYTKVCPSKYENGGRWQKGTVVEVVSSDSFSMQAWTEEQTATERRMTGARGPREDGDSERLPIQTKDSESFCSQWTGIRARVRKTQSVQ